MNTSNVILRLCQAGCALSLFAAGAFAAPPVVKTVPWVASNALIPHSAYNGKSITLKGTSDQAGAQFTWTWDFGDGSPVATGTVSNGYVIEAKHAYSGGTGTVYSARLTVQNTSTGETASRPYFVELKEKTLDVEVNIAIDEGLWFLHKNMHRYSDGPVLLGDWMSGSSYNIGYYGLTAANLNAFEVNGHLESGDPSNPYTETVQRAMRRVFEFLYAAGIGPQTTPLGTFNPDTNGNGIGVFVNQSYPFYQGGMFVDAIVASSTPSAIVSRGAANIIGRTYKDLVQDMVDAYSWAQYDSNPGGGWRYSSNEYPDNSACQWAAIALIAAERNWGCTVPAMVKDWNKPWLANTQYNSPGSYYHGAFGYTTASYFPWGPFATTPSGMVQLILDGIGRDMTTPAWPSWNSAEGFMRDTFANTGGATNSVKDYYYGLFSFVKSMLLHRTDLDEDGNLEFNPIVMLRSTKPGVAPIDWYSAETTRGDPTDGVARTLVNDQNTGGYWWGHSYESTQQYFETTWAIMMLHKTLFESGVPVAVAKAVPNPAVAGQMITIDGSDSYHQDPTQSIDSWQWDLDSNGTFDASGPIVSASFPSVGNYPVRLRVTDDSTPEKAAETTITVIVSTPPVPPTADADGPYVLCAKAKPWHLSGLYSRNPDDGQSEPHSPPYPGDAIKEYAWDLDDDGAFDDATGATPDVTGFFSGYAPGSYLIRLKVTDSTATAYPSSNLGDLSDTVTAQVIIGDDVLCACIEDLIAEPVLKGIALKWSALKGADHYVIYRSLTSGGPYIKIGTSPGEMTAYLDDQIGELSVTYFYVVRPALANGDELCQSNEASAEALHPEPTVTVTPATVSNLARYYYKLGATSPSFGRAQLQIFIGDTASSQVVGPLADGWTVYIRTKLPNASTRPGNATVSAYVMTKGSARVWAVDPLGQKSPEVIIP